MSSPELMKLLQPTTNPEELGIPQSLLTDVIFRLLFNEGEASVSRLAETMGIHVRVVDNTLSHMKQEHLVEVTKAGSMGSLSFTYSLTEAGIKRARDAMERSQYVGRLPVSLEAYNKAILLQTKERRQISPHQVEAALSHLILPDNFHRRVGPPLNVGSSLFLYGPPGNGKTTVAQALARLLAEDDPIWLPDAITVGGQIVRIHDPLVHEPLSQNDISMQMSYHSESNGNGKTDKLKVDNRWRAFKRPAVMVGGELTMEALDLRYEPIAKIYEAPLQLKANGGMFLIDDFGRQQISPQELLNRWIVPLESGMDFLRLRSGQSLEVPFRQFIVFSTNLDPIDLVDGAFLRRIQMKVEVGGPTEKSFYQIFKMACQSFRVPFDKNGFLYLLQKWYREPQRTLQSVHPRDILKIIIAICEYERTEPALTIELIDEACSSYFVDDLPMPGGSRQRATSIPSFATSAL
jgi:predicted ATPase with chaperone activity